jgi:hypothetical protein
MPKRTRKTLTAAERLLRSDGALCVTFVNAGVAGRRSLDAYDDLLAWGVEAGALADADARRLAGLAAEQPGKAADAVRQGQTLRIRGPLSPDILTSRGFGAF